MNYHHANILIFGSKKLKDIIISNGTSLYICRDYKKQDDNITIQDIQIENLKQTEDEFDHESILSHSLKPYDNIKKIIGNPEYFYGLSFDSKIFDTMLYGKIDQKINLYQEVKRIKDTEFSDPEKFTVKIKNKKARYKIYSNDVKKSNNIIVTLTSANNEMPKINTLHNSLKSIKRFKFFDNSYSIIVADGIKKGTKWDTTDFKSKYQQYKNKIKSEIDKKRNEVFKNTLFIESSEWNGPTRNLKKAINAIDSETVFLNQHDLLFADNPGIRNKASHHLQEDTIQKDFFLMDEILRQPNAVKYIIFARYWEIIRRPCICGSGKPYKDCCIGKCDGKDFKEVFAEERVKSFGVWWKFTNNDVALDDKKIYSVQGISDAQCFATTEFVKEVINFTEKRNPGRFVEDILHSCCRNNDIPKISGHTFLYHNFCCFHCNVRSKDRYLGQGVDRY